MKRILITVCFIVMILLTAGCQKKNAESTIAEQPPEQAKAPEQRTVQAFGVVKTKQVKGIMLDLPASIAKVHVQEGQQVKKGDVLITLSLKEIEEQIKEKEDSLKVARLELQKLLEDVGDKNNENIDNDPEIIQAKNNLDKIQIEYEKLEKDLKNKEIMLKNGAIPQNEFDDSKTILEQKQKEVESEKISLEDLKNKQRISNNKNALDVEIKKQNVTSLQSQLQTLNDKIAESGIIGNEIICDISNGVIEKVNNAAGDRLNAEKQVMSILDLDTLIVQANVAEDFIKDIKVGSKAVISPLANPEKEYEGTVSRISNMAVVENGETVVPVEIAITKVDNFLLPNFNINIKIILP
ncbi:MAG TPA: HlyD family efflux transporter periplasmic adaptor subunit [Clostridia bacterium]|nr:HlyD family efflux transporter periplasmic adaptor subunit [Clostridia bacterium]